MSITNWFELAALGLLTAVIGHAVWTHIGMTTLGITVFVIGLLVLLTGATTALLGIRKQKNQSGTE